MKKINSAIDRFCYQHPRFGIPNLMLWVVIGNVIVYVMDMMSRGTFSAMLSFVPAYIFQGQIWRLVTFVLVPNYGSNIFFFAISAYFYYFIGSRLENQWGTARFNFFYCSGIVLAIVVSLLLKGAYISALLPVLAILNYLIFFGDSLIEALRGRGQRVQHRYSRQTIHFKKAAKEAQQKTGYLHKCCVCGRTDADYPDLEFRYCSKCAGYRCYCMDHINNHVHVTEE